MSTVRRILLILMVAGLTYGVDSGVGQASSPNILVILTDDQRADTVTPLAMPDTRRWFINGGTDFTNGYAPNPLCCPSRASLYTGQYSHNHRVLTNKDAEALNHGHTVQAVLDDAGYHTGFVGKFLNDWPLTARPPHFDRWSLVETKHRDPRVNRDGTVIQANGYGTEVIRQEALRILEWFETHNDGRPWILFVQTLSPHSPYVVEGEHVDDPIEPWDGNPAVHEKDLSDKPPYVRNNPDPFTFQEAQERRSLQLRMLMTVDDLVNGVLSRLADLGEGDTLSMFLSDNGFMWGEHGLEDKNKPYTQSVAIPFLLRWPGHVPQGVTDGRLAATIDVAPTIFGATGTTPGWEVDGRSLLGPRRHHLLIEGAFGKVRIPRWRGYLTATEQYFQYHKKGALVFREHYQNDPWQLTNGIRPGTPLNPHQQQLAATVARDHDCAGSDCP
jgi:arylsulfatase A-like enzyme